MIPVKLGLRNFLSYTDIHEPLVFEGIHVACLSGENGAGKSSLLDAITWVLWGQSRAKTTDQLVHVGRTEMEVELEFLLAGQRYRVIRKRALRKTAGTTILDLAVFDPEAEQYRSIGGNSVSDTEKKIEELLRMSYTTFINSSFILQGRADAFTTRTPAERKQVLADILELSEYDRFQERARQAVQARELRHRELENGVREADTELARRPEYDRARQELEARLSELDDQLGRASDELERLRERLAGLVARERELGEATQQVGAIETTVARQQEEIASIRGDLEGFRRLIEHATEIELRYAELLRARQAEEELNGRLADFARLCDERNLLDKSITTARTRLEAELKGAEQQLSRLGVEAARLPEHEQEATKARADVEELARIQERRAGVETKLSAARERAAELRGANPSLRKGMEELRGKIDALRGSSVCPICRGELDERSREALIDQYTAEGKTQKAEYQRNLEQAKRNDGEAEQLTADLERLKIEEGQLLGVERRLAAAEQAVAASRRAACELETAAAERARLREALESGSYARAEIDALERLRTRIDGLGYDEAIHERVRDDVRRLTRYEAGKRKLDEAQQAIAHREQLLEQAERSLLGWHEQLARERRRVDELREETRDLPTLRTRAAEADRSLADRRREHAEANRAFGEARQRLDYLEHLERLRGERLREMEEVLREKSLFADLVTAFGKNGIQAMIIETAIPEIEDEANRLLGSMTGGRMHVKIQTQRDARSRDGTIETLDIVINDELGARPYEMYSGGEAFRVNFALRIALSRLLARRAGARLQTLVIDEGFGSQDEEGRERLVEAIQSIADQFEMILVITHLEEMKERFPVRIEVRKTALGSTTAIEWVD